MSAQPITVLLLTLVTIVIPLIIVAYIGKRAAEAKKEELRLKHEVDMETARQRPFIASEDHVDVSVQINEFGDLTAVSMKGNRKSIAQVRDFVEALKAGRQTTFDLDNFDAQVKAPEEETKKRSKR